MLVQHTHSSVGYNLCINGWRESINRNRCILRIARQYTCRRSFDRILHHKTFIIPFIELSNTVDCTISVFYLGVLRRKGSFLLKIIIFYFRSTGVRRKAQTNLKIGSGFSQKCMFFDPNSGKYRTIGVIFENCYNICFEYV